MAALFIVSVLSLVPGSGVACPLLEAWGLEPVAAVWSLPGPAAPLRAPRLHSPPTRPPPSSQGPLGLPGLSLFHQRGPGWSSVAVPPESSVLAGPRPNRTRSGGPGTGAPSGKPCLGTAPTAGLTPAWHRDQAAWPGCGEGRPPWGVSWVTRLPGAEEAGRGCRCQAGRRAGGACRQDGLCVVLATGPALGGLRG